VDAKHDTIVKKIDKIFLNNPLKGTLEKELAKKGQMCFQL
jgi:hypothetical protein